MKTGHLPPRIAAAALIALCLGGIGCRGGMSALAGGGDVVRLDGPGVLDRPGTEYLLARDVAAPGTAFVIDASDVTLDLGGHRVVYGTSKKEKAFGIEVAGFHRKNIRIRGGEIVQGEDAPCRGDANARGCNPVFIPHDAQKVEIADLKIVYHTPDTAGIHMHWAKEAHLYGNRIDDRGETVGNRHQGVAAVENTRGTGLRAHDNRIVRTRQIGIRTGEKAQVRSNDIRIDSVVTNSTGIAVKSGTIVANRIEGEGVHPIGIWPGNRTRVEENYVRVRSTRPGDEYGSTGAACLRMTWGNDEVTVRDNIFILEGTEWGDDRKGGWGRALWVGLPHAGERALFEGNVIVANNRTGKAKAAAVAVVCNNASPGLVFRGNTVVSNWGNVLLADDYGHADGFPRFEGNVFVRQDDFDGYRTIRSEYPGRPSTAEFFDNVFLNGAGEKRIELPYNAAGKKELRFGRTLRIEVTDGEGTPLPGAEVSVEAQNGEPLYRGRADERGSASVGLLEYRLVRPPGAKPSDGPATGNELLREEEGPYLLFVRDGDRRATRKVVPGGADGHGSVVIALPGAEGRNGGGEER